MNKKLNNKGYMLVEIILAFSIAFVLMYFIMDMVINLKNKNDDLLVKTLVSTDQTIIMNELMEFAMAEKVNFNCDNLNISGQIITYKDINGVVNTIDIVSDYAIVGEKVCNNQDNKISINIPLEVKQLEDENFDVVLDYKYPIVGITEEDGASIEEES